MSDDRRLIPGTVDWEAARADRAEARAERAEAALRPFAEMESSFDASSADYVYVARDVKLGDLRRARAVLAQIEKADDA